MKRFRRWLFNGLTAISLMLCLGTIALWFRTYFAADSLTYERALPVRPPVPLIIDGMVSSYIDADPPINAPADDYRMGTARGEIYLSIAADFVTQDDKWKRETEAPYGISGKGVLGFIASSWGQLDWILDADGYAVPSTKLASDGPWLDVRVRFYAVPLWLLVLVFATLPFWRFEMSIARSDPACAAISSMFREWANKVGHLI